MAQVWFALAKINPNKSTVKGDFPAKLIKIFAAYLADPFTDIVNASIAQGRYPQIYKYEVSTPVPKIYPTENTDQLRNISGLLNFDKTMEKLIAELMISDMKSKLDPSQYGNETGISIQHYLIKMIHRILSNLDNNQRKQTFAVLANFIDWNNAFPRQCPNLGIKSFLSNGVRPSLIPMLINYFQDREMTVKWHGCFSTPRKINGGGPQGATIGILEYLSQSNNNTDFIDNNDKFKFVDDLTVLETINLLSVGLTSYNIKEHIPSDISVDQHFIPPQNLKSHQWLLDINAWTLNQKMQLNKKKTKNMFFNYTNNYQSTTRLNLENQNIEVLNSTKLLGTIISNDLKWDLNIKHIVKKANARMAILRRASQFKASIKDLKIIYFSYIHSQLEQSASVWHSSLTLQNITDLERVQKTAMKIILKNQYKGYKNSLHHLEMDSLLDRREQLCLNFAIKCLKNKKMKTMFPLNLNLHNNRTKEVYFVQHANTERLKKSSIIYMQNLLNKYQSKKYLK